MSSNSISDIISSNESELISIITTWKQFDINTVVFAYAELNRRGYNFTKEESNALDSFTRANYNSDINTLLKTQLGYKGVRDYTELVNQSSKDASSNKVLITKNNQAEQDKYPFLSIITSLLSMLGVLSIIISIIVAIVSIKLLGSYGLPAALLNILLGSVCSVFLFAFSEAIKVLKDIEYNTRNKN